MIKKVQQFGGAMLAPALLFSFAGIVVGFAILFKNAEIMGSLASPDGTWFKIWDVVSEGAWAVFRQIPLLFVIGLPIGLAKKQQARACLEALVIYLTFNYFLSSILNYWGTSFGVNMEAEVGSTSGLALIAGVKTLDTGMVGALIISAIVVFLHNRYFDFPLPEMFGVFKGTSFIVILGFVVMLPVALLFAAIWPIFQGVIMNMQDFFIETGNVGIWVYSFLEKILIPTGLHHFIYSPFAYDSIVVPGGTAAYFSENLETFQTTSKTLKEMFPIGFSLSGMSKVFGSIGIVGAFYHTAKPEKRKAVLGLMIPVALTAMMSGITEPLEFTFLFTAPVLFVVHALLSATVSTVAFAFGVVGNFGGGLINWFAINWAPLWKYHYGTYITQIIIGLIFAVIWYVVFTFLILKLNLATPGREKEDQEMKLYSKKDYEELKETQALSKANGSNEPLSENALKAASFLELLGGKGNIVDVTNCMTRLRLTVKDSSLVANDPAFREKGAMGLVKKGEAVQVIVGLSVPSVRDEFEKFLAE